MDAKDTLFHINWGDGDDSFIIAPDEATARKRMADGKDMVNYVVRHDALYQMIFKAGREEERKVMIGLVIDEGNKAFKNGKQVGIKEVVG